MNTIEIERSLARRFKPPAWAYVTNVASAMGFKKKRCADAMAMGIWESRGIDLHGFEIKASRSDWLRELNDPAKADEIAIYCDFWWVVAGDASIVLDGEMPATWGLMIPSRRGAMKTIVKAQRRTARPMSRDLLAGMLRRSDEKTIDRAELEKARQLGRDEQRHCQLSSEKSDIQKLRRLENRIAQFEEASGVQFNTWRATKDIGDAVKIVLNAKGLFSNLPTTLEHAERLVSVTKDLIRETTL